MAANLTIKMNGNINAWKVTNAEGAKIMAYYTTVYPNADGSAKTEAEVVAAMAQAFVSGITANAVRHARDEATKTAVAAIPDIAPTTDTAA